MRLIDSLGTVVTTGALGTGFLGGLIAVIAITAVVVYLIKKPKVAV